MTLLSKVQIDVKKEVVQKLYYWEMEVV